jgi:hypothetical protein
VAPALRDGDRAAIPARPAWLKIGYVIVDRDAARQVPQTGGVGQPAIAVVKAGGVGVGTVDELAAVLERDPALAHRAEERRSDSESTGYS